MGMDVKRRRLTALSAAICMLSAAMVTANLNSTPITSDTGSISTFITSISAFIFPTTVVLWIVVFIGAVINRNKIVAVGKLEPSNGRVTLMGIALVLGVIIVLSLFIQSGVVPLGDNRGQGLTQDPGQSSGRGGTPDATPPIITMLSLLPLIAILALIGYLAYNRFRAERDGVHVLPHAQPNERRTVEKAIAAIHAGGDIRGSIITAYSQMCQLVRDTTIDEKALTPRELENDLVHTLRWPPDPVHQLTLIFEEARYSEHALTERDKVNALANLTEIRKSLGGDHG